MPYVKTIRGLGGSNTTYLPWPEVVRAGLREVTAEALSEPGVSAAELMDDCRSRVLVLEKDLDVLGAEIDAEIAAHAQTTEADT